MKNALVIVLVLCATTACNDTEPRKEWRSVEARLSTQEKWGEYAPPPKTDPATPLEDICYDPIDTARQASALLEQRPHCVDSAIAALTELARDDRALNDLAAAHYARATRTDRPSDLFKALDAARRALRLNPRNDAARFNEALLLGDLGLTEAALASWNGYIDQEASNDWKKEAVRRRDELRRRSTGRGFKQWEINKGALPAALAAGDAAAVARLIHDFPKTAQMHFEDKVLLQWAKSGTRADFEQASLLANALSKRFKGDRFNLDVLRGDPALTRKGILLYEEGSYSEAVEVLRQAGNPFWMAAGLHEARLLSFDDDDAPALARNSRVEEYARRHQYRQILGRALAMRGFIYGFQSRYLEGIDAYERAVESCRAVGDDESIVNFQVRIAGQYRYAGHYEFSGRAIAPALREEARIVKPTDRHALLGETASLAYALGHPHLARDYFDIDVDLFKSSAPLDPGSIDALATVLFHRARTHLVLGQPERARSDWNEAKALILQGRQETDVLETLARSIEGRIALATSATSAIAAFTEALNSAPADFPTQKTELLAQRGEAYLRANDIPAAMKDLREAVAVLRTEEAASLASSERDRGEELWDQYFSRFDAAYELLIRNLLRDGRQREAFNYVEHARAYEPLALLRQRKSLPENPALDVQKLLEPGTFLVEYYVASDITWVWILSREDLRVRALGPLRDDISRWTTTLQRFASRRGGDPTATLQAAYDRLIRPVLQQTEEMRSVPAKRLVIIPHRAMTGLPFSALHDSRRNQYLFDQAVIEIAGSASLYTAAHTLDRDLPATASPSILLFGNPTFDRSLEYTKHLDPLPGAITEVERVARLYTRRTVLTDTRATVPEFLKLAPDHDILHIAAHALIHQQDPTQSLILLAKSQHDNGVLRAEQLLTDLKLDRTRLVILSACHSASGDPLSPRGIAPLVRPLIVAGVPAVIGSVWNVEDATAADLLVSFHSAWRGTNDAAVALQAAQRSMLRHRKPDRRSVLAWGPFQVIGHASAPNRPPP